MPKPTREERRILISAETLLKSRWMLVVVPAVLLIPLLVPINDQLRFHVLWGVMGKRLHLVVFAALTVWLRYTGPIRMNWIVAALMAMCAGAVIELLQSVTGRTASLVDLVHNAIGVGFGLVFIAWRSRRRLTALLLAAPLLMIVLYQLRDLPRDHAAFRRAESRFPMISDFASVALDHTWVAFFGAETGYVSRTYNEGEVGRVLQLRFPAVDSYPGVATQSFPLNWSNYRFLCAEMRIAHGEADTLTMGLRLEDAGFLKDGDWHSGSFTISPEWELIRVPLEGVQTKSLQRPLDLRRVITLKFFVKQPEWSGSVEIDNVRLE